MAAPDWETIKQIFSEALNVPPSVRDAYVERACDGRADVCRAVADLLRAHADASQNFLEPDSIVVRAAWLFAPGESVAGRFRVVKPIARGAMGEVYQVHDERLRLSVALKAIRPELLSDAESVERFRREVLVTRDIAHDGLCRVFDLIEHPMPPQAGFPAGTVVPCLTMQLLEGVNLEDWLAAHRPMPIAEAMPLVRQIADALQVLHDAGVIHRDLKPSNVMLVQSGTGMRAVLTDFGLAKPIEERLFETQRAVHGGAPFFMAPELFKGERPSRASDIYAFGLLIDEMVTVTRAFAADSLHSLLLQKLGDGPEPVSRRASGIPQRWERTIRRSVARDPRHRFESARAALASLEHSSAWQRWRDVFRWRHATYLPNRRRLAGYSLLATVALSGVATLGLPLTMREPMSVAIGRFVNLTNNRDLEYVAVGTAGELARRLSGVSDLRVYNAADPTGPVDRSRLATLSLQGHIQQVDTKLRITVRVTDTAQGTVLWSQNVDGSIQRFLDLEDQLAAETVGALVRLRPKGDGPIYAALSLFGQGWPRPSLPRSGTTNSAAFDAYLRGRTLFEERTLTSSLKAIDFLKRAVQQDPNFAAPYATLADVQGVLMDLHYAPHAVLLAEAEHNASQAVALDPNLPDAQLSLASLRQMQWKWDDADAAYRRAIDLHPTSARAHRWYGGLLLQFGRFEQSLERHRHAIDLDPYDYPNQSAYGHALFHSGRALEAAAHLERVVAQKDLLYAHALLGQVYAYLSSGPAERSEYLQKALQESLKLRQAETPIQVSTSDTAISQYADLVAALAWSYQGNLSSAAPFVERLETGRAHGRISPGTLARIYAAQHDVTRAMEALLQAEAQHDRELYYVNVSPYYAGIRDEPQFRALVERLRLTR